MKSFSTRTQARHWALAAAIVLFLVMVSGGILRVAGSGGGCPDWPTCFGGWTPPVGTSATLDYLHRTATLLALPLVLGAAWLGRRERRLASWIRRSLDGAAAFTLLQVLLGGVLVLGLIPGAALWGGLAHLVLSLLALGAATAAAVGGYFQARAPGEGRGLSFRSPFSRLALVTLAGLFILMASGGLLTLAEKLQAGGAPGAGYVCAGWPLCPEGLLPTSLQGWLHAVHRLIVLGAALLSGLLFVRAWQTQRSQIAVLTAATAYGVLFFAQALLGAKLVEGFPAYLLGLHEATAVAAWGALAVLVVAAGLAQRTAGAEAEEAAEFAARRPGRMALDLLLLTKPVVVALLLVTTYAGMVIGARAWPSLGVTFWTLLGGFLAAGGSGAINQFIDRDDDRRMQRTQKRPIPAGRLTEGEGLAFGVGIALASFFLLTAFVNFLAALLSLAGIFYYVLLYSIFLKKTTVQNIVIGGGAGAIPPLVGWAAATGSLNIPSLFLFAVVFLWTPPHFWALALVRRKDYARAGVPMLPVVRGEEETRKQIFIYTLELVGLTLLLPVAGLGGAVYLVGAGALGLWLISAAWRVWKQGGNKVAWKMYRYSSMYLAFLFVVLMVDRLL